MPGTKLGGLRAAATNKERHGDDFYRKIGGLSNDGWEANGRKPRGFSVMPFEKVSAAGYKGGKISKPGTRKQNKEQ